MAISAFFFSYRLFQLQEAKSGTLTFLDVLKAWTRKYLRLAPTFYFIFFLSWFAFPHMASGPIWYKTHDMFF